VTAFGLGVRRIFDLDPGRLRAISVVLTAGPLGDDTFRVLLARGGIEVVASAAHVIQEAKARTPISPDQLPEPALPLEERETALICAVELEQVEA
jgi:hypothetical protein